MGKKFNLVLLFVLLSVISLIFFGCGDSTGESTTIEDIKLSDIKFESQTIVYDGELHTLEIKNLPDYITVTYSENKFKDIGTYDVTATLSKEGEDAVELTAQLIINPDENVKYKVTFKQDGFEDIVKEVTMYSDLDISTVEAPKPVLGYDVKWEEKDLTHIMNDVVVNAVEEVINYNIEYDLAGGENDEQNLTSYTINSDTVMIYPAKKLHSDFLGWYMDDDDNNQVLYIKHGSTGNVLLHAKWRDHKIEAAQDFYLTDGKEPILEKLVANDIENIDLNDLIDVSSDCSWKLYSDKDKTNELELKVIPLNTGMNKAYIVVSHQDSSIETIYELQIYKRNKYNYEFVVDGNSVDSGIVEEDSVVNDLETVPTKDGYVFSGWKVENEIVEFPYVVNKDVTFNCCWEIENYNITYNVNGGKLEGETTTFNIKDEVVFVDPTLLGYTFIGWYDNVLFEGDIVLGIEKGNFGDKEYFAKWEPIEYSVTLNTNGGSVKEKLIKYNIETPTFDLEVPTKVGYEFKGWSENPDIPKLCNQIQNGSTGDKVLYALWAPINYNIIYNANGGNLSGDNNEYNIENGAMLEIPTKVGYTFEGWFDSEEFLGEPIHTIDIGSHGDKTLFAKWSLTQYKVTLEKNGGDLLGLSTFYYTIETENIDLEIPTKTGYTFMGWFDSIQTNYPITKIETGTFGDIVLYAGWQPTFYTIMFDVNFGDHLVTKNLTVHYDEAYTLPIPERYGYDFFGWYDGESLVSDGVWNRTEDLLVIAKWEPQIRFIDYKLDYDVNNDLNISEFTIEDLGNGIKLNPAKKPGYEFIGWYLEASHQTEITEITNFDNYILYPYFKDYSDGLKFTNTNDGYIVSGYSGYDLKVVIPTKYNGLPVTAIGDGAFQYCTSMYYVSIPQYVTSIGEDAFDGCTNLQNVVIPQNVKNIGIRAFSYTGIAEVIFESNTNLEILGAAAFAQCNALTSIELPISLTRLDDQIFYESGALQSITIPKAVKSIGFMCFQGCYSLREVNFEEDCELEEIEGSAFIFCDLHQFKLPRRCVTIGDSILNLNPDLQYIEVEDGNEKYYSLYAENAIIEKGTEKVIVGSSISVLHEGVREIGDTAYCGRHFIYFRLPESVEIIGEAAFAMSDIKNINITKNIKQIGDCIFDECNELYSITVDERNQYFKAEGNCVLSKDGTTVIAGCNNSVIPNTATNIENRAFEGLNIDSIVIPYNIENIEVQAFYDCTNLTIYCEVTSKPIGWSDNWNDNGPVVWGYNNLSTNDYEYVLHDNTVFLTKYLAKYANVSIPNQIYGADVVGFGTIFAGNESIRSINIPGSINRIENSAFERCRLLQDVNIEKGVKSVGDRAFYGCDIKDIVIPASVNNIGINAFSYNTELELIEVDINNQVYRSENNCIIERNSEILILGCKNSIIPNSVVSIGDYAFCGSNIQDINITSNVNSIGESAFEGCTELKSIVIPISVTVIGRNAFDIFSSVIIYCEASNKPVGWDDKWNPNNKAVGWRYKK